MKEAVNLVKNENYSIRQAAALKGLAYQTLSRYVKKVGDRDITNLKLSPKYDCRKVFSCEQEDSLVKYLIMCSAIGAGATSKKCRTLAFEMAKINNIQTPAQWDKDKAAGREWLHGFKKRHPELALRKPEGCSLSRAILGSAKGLDSGRRGHRVGHQNKPIRSSGCERSGDAETQVCR